MILQEVIEKDIFSLMGLEKLSEEEKRDVFQKASETILNRILLRLADQLSEEEVKTIVQFAEKDDSVGFEKLLADKGIDLEMIAAEETLAYKTEMASISEALKIPS